MKRRNAKREVDEARDDDDEEVEDDDSDFEAESIAKSKKQRAVIAKKAKNKATPAKKSKAKKAAAPSKRKSKRSTDASDDSQSEVDDDDDFEPQPKKKRARVATIKKDKNKATPAKRKKGKAKIADEDEDGDEDDDTTTKTPLGVQNAELVSDAVRKNRALQSQYYIGAHVSIQKGVYNAVNNAVNIGASAFACFLGSSRSWKQSKESYSVQDARQFTALCRDAAIDPATHVLPHGSYLMNLGSPHDDVLQKSRQLFLIDLKRCAQLGIGLFNFHPGSHLNEITAAACCTLVAESINWANRQLGTDVKVVSVIECTAGQGTNIGYTFEQLRDIISQVDDKSRVGICLDTCHMFGAGYDLRTAESCRAVFAKFDEIVGFNYLRGMHINDSKSKLNARVDRHATLGTGFIGNEVIKFIMQDARFKNIPLILETPADSYYRGEITAMYAFTTATDTTTTKEEGEGSGDT